MLANNKGEIKVKSLHKALMVLDCFAEKQPLSITEISEELGLYKSNVYDILSTLCAMGYLDEQAIANEYVMPVTFKDDLTVVMPCPPVKFSEYDMREYTPTGRIGADTDAVFAELGYTPEQINALREKNSII